MATLAAAEHASAAGGRCAVAAHWSAYEAQGASGVGLFNWLHHRCKHLALLRAHRAARQRCGLLALVALRARELGKCACRLGCRCSRIWHSWLVGRSLFLERLRGLVQAEERDRLLRWCRLL